MVMYTVFFKSEFYGDVYGFFLNGVVNLQNFILTETPFLAKIDDIFLILTQINV